MTDIRRRTTCRVEGHGTRCEVAHEKPNRWPRTTERRLALDYEQAANTEIGSTSDAEAPKVEP